MEKGQPLAQKAIFSVVNNRRLFHSMLRAASMAQKPFAEGRIHPPPAVLPVGPDRVPQPAGHRRRCRSATGSRRSSSRKRKEKVAFYAGCLIDFAYPEMGEALVKILNKAGIEVVFPEGQTCCGAPARYSGAYEVAAQNAIDNIKALLEEDVDYVVSACPTCTVALKHEFINTFESLGQTDALPRARELAAKVIDFSTLVKKLVDEGRLTFKEGQQLGKITYHDSCHLKRTLHVSQQPRELLHQGRLRGGRDVRVRHVLRHGRLVLAEAAGDLGAHPRAQAEEHQERPARRWWSWTVPAASCRFAAASTKTARTSRSSIPRSGWRTSWSSC